MLPDCQYCKVLLHFNLDHLEYAITGDMNFMAAFDEQTWRKKDGSAMLSSGIVADLLDFSGSFKFGCCLDHDCMILLFKYKFHLR